MAAILFWALLGAAAGSFGLVVAGRSRLGRSWMRGRSACPRCGERLASRDLVPLVSWALARGRARCCGQSVSWRYPAIELIGALAFALGARTGVMSALAAAGPLLAACAVALIPGPPARGTVAAICGLAAGCAVWGWAFSAGGPVAALTWAGVGAAPLAVLLSAGRPWAPLPGLGLYALSTVFAM